MLIKYGSLILAIIFETIATSFLKQSEQFTKLVPSIITITGYILSFYFLSITVKTIPIGIVYAIWSGVGIFFIAMIGLFVFKQTLDAPACIGLAFIVSGVLIINLFSKTVSH
ncbi:MAG: DMT family transporter [Alphaproteobacteria bacterium]